MTDLDSYLTERACDPELVHVEDTPRGLRFKNYLSDGTYSEQHSPIRLREPKEGQKFTNAKDVSPRPLAVNPDVWNQVRKTNAICIAEGCAKAGALVSIGLPAVGILGVSMWRAPGTETLHADLAAVINNDTLVEFIPDGDWRINANINREVCKFMTAVRRLGAVPHLVEVPLLDDGKTGIDDVIARWKEAGRDPLNSYSALPRTSTPPILHRLGEDIATVEPPPPKAVIPNILPCRSTIIQGAGHEGKTVTQLYLAIHIAMGKPIFGQPIERPGKVLYVFGEDDTDDLRRIVHYLIRARPDLADQGILIHRNLELLNAANLPDTPSLLTGQDGNYKPGRLWDYIESVLVGGGYSAVIFDTLSSLSLPEKSGMNEALAAYHRQASAFCTAFDIAVVGSHHLSQEAAQSRAIGMYSSRGATATADNARCVLHIQRHDQRHKEDLNYIPPEGVDVRSDYVARLHVVKHKWSHLRADTPLWLVGNSYVTYDYPEVENKAELVAQRRELARHEERSAKEWAITAAIMELEKRNNGVALQGSIAEETRISEKTVRTYLANMEARGEVRIYEHDTGRRGTKPKAATLVTSEKF